MDILNWLYLVKKGFTRTTVENPDKDLVLLGADVTFAKRGDKYQNYAITAKDFSISTKGYKSTVFYITQKSTDNPILQLVFIDEIGGTWTPGYGDPGVYKLENDTVSLALEDGFVAFYTPADPGNTGLCSFEATGSGLMGIASYDVATDALANDMLNGYLEIRQYI